MTESPLRVERHGAVLVLRMDRPQVRNAVDVALSHALAAAFTELDEDPGLAVGVLTGGDVFSAGMDLKGFREGDSIEVPGRGLGGLTRRPPAKPVIAAVEGYALAGGFEMVLACDLVVAGRGAVFGLPEVKRGLVAGSGGLLRLARWLPPAVVSDLAFTGRRFGAEEAGRWGIVTEIVDDGAALARAVRTAEELATSSPFALMAAKRILQAGADLPAAEAWQVQDETLEHVLASADAAEGAAAFLDKREPRWTGR